MQDRKKDDATPNTHSTSESRNFLVVGNDNFQPPDDNKPINVLGSFETYEEAVTCCKRIIEAGLKEMYADGMTADQLYRTFSGFGDTAFVIPIKAPDSSNYRFSSQEYAKEMSKDICSGKSILDVKSPIT